MSYGGEAFGPYNGISYAYGQGFTPILNKLPAMAVASSFARKLSNLPLPVATIRRDTDSTTLDLYGAGPHGFVPLESVRNFNGWNLFAQSANLSATWVAAGGASIGSATTFSTSSTADRVQQTRTVTAGTYTFTVKFGEADIGKVIRLAYFSGSWDYGSNITIDANGYASRTFTSVSSITNFAMSGTGSLVSYAAFEFAQLEQASAFSTYEPRTTTVAGNSCFTTRYDHSGNDRHWTQSSTSLQRYACIQGVVQQENGRLTSYGVAADARRMSIGSSTAMFNFLHTTGGTVLAIAKANDTASNKYLLANKTTQARNGIVVLVDSSERLTAITGRVNVAGVATDGSTASRTSAIGETIASNKTISLIFDADNGTAADRIGMWINGTASTGTANGTSTTPFVEDAEGNLTLGATSGGLAPWDGTLTEDLIYQGSLTTAQRQFYEQNAMQLWGLS